MPILDSEKRKLFQEQGFILLENAIDSQLLKGLQRDFNGWVKDSINHSKPYGKMLDGLVPDSILTLATGRNDQHFVA